MSHFQLFGSKFRVFSRLFERNILSYHNTSKLLQIIKSQAIYYVNTMKIDKPKIKKKHAMRKMVPLVLTASVLASIGLVTTATIAVAITLDGTPLNDKLIGTPFSDTISGRGGNDEISGLEGGDKLYGDADNDKILGQEGNDRVRGGTGNDGLSGGAGHDTIYGDEHSDSLSGSQGNDLLVGGSGDDVLSGGTGADTFNCGSGKDRIVDYSPSSGDKKSADCERF